MLKKLFAGCVALIMSTGIVHAEDSALTEIVQSGVLKVCLLYTSDAADE